MKTETVPMRRLEEWLKKRKLPKDARTCIENFVLSCDEIDEGDVSNFMDIDIRDFPRVIQERLIEGFFYAYVGEEGFKYMLTKDSVYHIGLN